MRLKDCYDKGLLRKRRPDKEKSRRALEIAGADVDRAYELMESGFHAESRLLSYTGMFGAARALLYRDGVFERSHVCVVEYLRRRYTDEHILGANYISWLDTMRVERHESLYGLERAEVTREEAEDSHEKAGKFVERIREIFKGED